MGVAKAPRVPNLKPYFSLNLEHLACDGTWNYRGVPHYIAAVASLAVRQNLDISILGISTPSQMLRIFGPAGITIKLSINATPRIRALTKQADDAITRARVDVSKSFKPFGKKNGRLEYLFIIILDSNYTWYIQSETVAHAPGMI